MSQAGQEYENEVVRVAAGRAKGRSLGSLRHLLPFLRPYRGQIAFAAVALVAIMATGSFQKWERAMFAFIAISSSS